MSTVSVNTHFPGYEILGELGRSNARVLKARHLATGDLVAIKHFTLGTDAETLRRFQQESAIMTSVRHPNVVQVREVQLDMPMPFIVMEWVEGGDLRALINRQGHLDVPMIIRLGLQMAGAFNAIHPQGIIHRDIKPENILYRPLPSGELHFLLTDFGIARLNEQSHTMTGQSLMTYEYASPEQFDNPRGLTIATDYYSMGVVLYECLTGRVPFSVADNGGIATFMNQVLRAPTPILALPPDQYLPPSLETLVTWTLTKNPDERLSDVNEFTLLLGQANVEQLQANRSGNRPAPTPYPSRTIAAPSSVTPLSEPEEPIYDDEPASNSNWWGIAVGVLVVCLLIGLVAYYKQSQKVPAASVMTDSTAVTADSTISSETPEDTATFQAGSPAEDTVTDSVATQPSTTPAIEPTPGTSATTVTDTTAVKDSSNANQ